MNDRKDPFVSVIVCAFNEEALLGDCLSALSKQTYAKDRYEILVIDDESTDRTPEIAENFIASLSPLSPRMRWIRIAHGGLSVARNAGIVHSAGDIIAFIDGDAVAAPTWLEKLVVPFLEGADYVGGRIDLLNTESWVARFLQNTRHRQFFGPKVLSVQLIGCNMAYRKEIFEAVGGFFENFVSRGDEVSLRESIPESFRYKPARDAVVLHERPSTLKSALKVRWESGKLDPMVAKAVKRPWKLKAAILGVEQYLIILFPLFSILLWFWPALLAVWGLSAAALFRQTFIRRLNRQIFIGLVGNYGIVRALLGHFLNCYTTIAMSGLGRLVGLWIHRKTEIIPPMTRRIRVQAMFENRPGR